VTRKTQIRALIEGALKSERLPINTDELFKIVAKGLPHVGPTVEKSGFSVYVGEPDLKDEDLLLAQEVVWDLVIEKVITPGRGGQAHLPWFRLHSESDRSR